ncbi:hypothetical protein E2C01_028954 [Portunus trituberculatus]|uniref:Uncharacterized protein n=1 Tax=Portunus trituberculatus TaxID=210409 RepID=A0A5B7EQX3_PORTR|nr:hypothetical protein [Portunus trituberculatus]
MATPTPPPPPPPPPPPDTTPPAQPLTISTSTSHPLHHTPLSGRSEGKSTRLMLSFIPLPLLSHSPSQPVPPFLSSPTPQVSHIGNSRPHFMPPNTALAQPNHTDK